MIICVASGKGGTGKTTVAVNLAAAVEAPLTFVDCDVEEPNAHIFLSPELDHASAQYSMVPEVDKEKCDDCRKCAEICRFAAITVVGSKPLLFPEMCHGCAGCLEVCPTRALLPGKKEIGVIEQGRRGEITFLSGTLKIGEAMAPPLVKKLRKFQTKGEDVIIDAPPGTSCPVIASMAGADFILLVTEPTPFGLHDLVLAHETVKKLGLPCAIVINRAGLGNHEVEEYAEQQQIPVLMKIPLSRQIAAAYSRGQLLIDEIPEWKARFKKLQQTIMLLDSNRTKSNARVCHTER